MKRGAWWTISAAISGLITLPAVAQTPPIPVDSTLTPSMAPTPSGSAAAVFRRFSRGVVKIQVTSNGTNAKASLGSGLFVDSLGSVITNYHVISKLILDPKRYHADLTDGTGAVIPVRVVAIDVVHDLALLRSTAKPSLWLSLDSTRIDQGDRLYALGHPLDLGLTIVEGTYNGLLEHTLYPKIHFTGSMNSGMSGGPTLTADGRVAGINVATAGNGIGFLVPVSRARALMTRAAQPKYAANDSLLKDATRQILAYQDIYLRGMFVPGAPTVRLGSYILPTKPAPFFKCWADTRHDDQGRYDNTFYLCSTSDDLFISDELQSGVAQLTHQLTTTTTLNMPQFYSLYTDQLSAPNDDSGGDEKSVTRFACQSHNVAHTTAGSVRRPPLRVIFCARAYKHLPGLYDAIVKVATLGSANSGVISTLQLSGVSYKNAQTLAGRFLRSIAWTL